MKSTHAKIVLISLLGCVVLFAAITNIQTTPQVQLSQLRSPSIIGAEPQVTVNAKLGPISVGGESDDPAIWQHPTNTQKSLFFVMNKGGTFAAYDFTGAKIQQISMGTAINNIDVRKGFNFNGQQIDIVAANLRDAGKLAVMQINPNWTTGNAFTVLAGNTCTPATCVKNTISGNSYGFTLFKSKTSGKVYTFEKPKSSSPIKQWEVDGSTGKIDVKDTGRSFTGYGVAEGFVADDAAGIVYFAEEASGGIHKHYAEPTQPTTKISTFASGDGIAGQREGLALYACNDGSGYLVVSSQGNSTFKVYDRTSNVFVKTFSTDKSHGTDGLDVSSASVPGFPNGFAIIQNDTPTTGGATPMSYYIYDWGDIAQTHLKICPNGGGGGTQTTPPPVTPPPNTPPPPTATPLSRACIDLHNRFSITNPSGYSFTKGCLETSFPIYQNENRFTFFKLPINVNEIPYIKTPNTTIKDQTSLVWSVTTQGNSDMYIFYRKIPGQAVPSWISSAYQKQTPEGFTDLNAFVLRKNEQGLIGVFDIYKRTAGTGVQTFGPASTTLQNAFSMYIVAINPL
ncbi:MAG: phytase [bacterium]|nr:phytase [bacterium]